MLDEQAKTDYMSKMADNLGILRKKLKLTQAELAKRIGVSRQTLMDIENKKRLMTWGVFMSLFGVFRENEDTSSLLVFYSISTEELTKFITNR
jgi:DNA-binding XRE family transcriptional regulator